jgi:opacity protein-like surface antigen
MRNFIVFFMAVLICSFGTLSAQGLYVGAGIGNTFYGSEFTDIEDQVNDISENSTGYKFFAGFKSPSIFGIEGGYRNFGTVDTNIGDFKFESQTTGWDVYGMAHFEVLLILDLFAKAGVLFWSSESKLVEQVIGDESGTAFSWGLGAGVSLGPIGVRLEWENFHVKDPETLSAVMLSATMGF